MVEMSPRKPGLCRHFQSSPYGRCRSGIGSAVSWACASACIRSVMAATGARRLWTPRRAPSTFETWESRSRHTPVTVKA